MKEPHYREWLRRLGIRTGPKQHKAMGYLESRGQVFMVDFGYQNAVEKAREDWRNRRRKRR